MRFGGILGVAYAYAALTAPAGILNLYIAGQYMNLSVRTILLEVGRIFVIAALMGVVVFWFETSIAYAWPSGFQIIGGVLIGVSSFVGMCVITRDEAFAEFAQLLADKFVGLRRTARS